MDTLITTHSISSLNLKNPKTKSQFHPPLLHLRPSALLSVHPSVKVQYFCNGKTRSFLQKGFGVLVSASVATQSNTSDDGERWLLEPVGDGDSRHIGYKVAMPSAFEIASSEVTIGRVPEKADIVIPVATVSGMHARLQKKGSDLLVTDLDSTNGTFIDEKRLTPGVPSIVPSGRYLTFGDTNLAIFRVSKLKNVKLSEESSDPLPQVQLETEDPNIVVESTSQNI